MFFLSNYLKKKEKNQEDFYYNSPVVESIENQLSRSKGEWSKAADKRITHEPSLNCMILHNIMCTLLQNQTSGSFIYK